MGKLYKVKCLKAVFLDRDGVLNEPTIIDGRPFPPKDLSDLVIYNGAAEYLTRLKKLGFLLVVATN